MALITGEAQYSDLFEWQLYNAAAVGMGLTGDRYPVDDKGLKQLAQQVAKSRDATQVLEEVTVLQKKLEHLLTGRSIRTVRATSDNTGSSLIRRR